MKKLLLSTFLLINIPTQSYTEALSRFINLDKITQLFKTNTSNRKKLITAVQDLDFNTVSTLYQSKEYTDAELAEAQQLIKIIMLQKKHNSSWYTNHKALSKIALGLVATSLGGYLCHEIFVRDNLDLQEHREDIMASEFAPIHIIAFGTAICSALIVGPALMYNNIQKLRAQHQPEYQIAFAINALLNKN